MSSFKSSIMAAAAILATANAHITMEKPVPYSIDKLDNSPITQAQFPCKSQNGFTVSTMNSMKVGEKQQVSFKGTAVHGGGSCQLSVTMDTEPSAKSVFKVVKSIEGGCPGVDGTTNTYDFELPASIPNGKATFAWTWFAKMSGAPEMYMNCAPIEVTGGAEDDSKFNELPDMFVGNLGQGCTTAQNFATKFPNPGDEVQDGGTGDAKAPTGECGATGSSPPSSDPQPSGGAGQPEPSGGATQPSGGAGEPTTPEPTSGAGEPVPSPPSGGSVPSAPAESAPAESAPEPSNPGGVFAPGASGAPAGPTAPAPTTMMTQTGSPSGPVGTGTPSNPPTGGGGAGEACSENGAILCQGESKFGLCNNGQVVWQDVAAGTACVNGVISKRSYNGRIARPRAVY